MNYSNKNFKKGFTLIELLVVIAIIGILSSVVLASLNTARSKARDTARIASMLETRKALQVYFNDKGEFPYIGATGVGTPGAEQWKTGIGYGLVEQGYIKDVHPEIRYYTIRENFSNTCASSANTCVIAWMYVKLENWNSVLNSDRDRNFDNVTQVYTPDGLSSLNDCIAESGVNNTTDLCFDLEV